MRVGPTPREGRDIGRMPCNARGKNWSDAAASQEMPRALPSALPSEARKKQGRIPPTDFRGSTSLWHLNFSLLVSEL